MTEVRRGQIVYGILFMGGLVLLAIQTGAIFNALTGAGGTIDRPTFLDTQLTMLRDNLDDGCEIVQSAGEAADREATYNFTTAEYVRVESNEVIEGAEEDSEELSRLEPNVCERVTFCQETTAESGCTEEGRFPGEVLTLRMSFENQTRVGPVSTVKVVEE